MRVALIGFMGVGKTDLAGELGGKLSLPVLVLDRLIEARAGKSIDAIFADDGEDMFRRLEERALVAIEADSKHLLDCGGGVVESPSNRRVLRSRYRIIYLCSGWLGLWDRLIAIDRKGRPLLRGKSEKDIRSVFERRSHLYEKTAHHIVDAEQRSPGELADEIVELLDSAADA